MSSRFKKILLAILLGVAGYVWWGNIQLFTGSDSGGAYDESDEADSPASVKDRDSRLPVYQPPRVNPFQHAARSSSSAAPSPATPPPPPHLPDEYGLTGFIVKGQNSQAVVRIGQGGSSVLSIGDSLSTWRLVQIIDRAAIFEYGKTRDTLRLEAPEASPR